MNKVKINNKEYSFKRYPIKKYDGEFSIEITLADYKYFMDWYDLAASLIPRLKSECVKDVESITDDINFRNHKYINCLVKSISWSYDKLYPIGIVEITYDAFEEQYKKPKETNIELVPIEIPEGKKLIKTELESGLLLTFEEKTNVDDFLDNLKYFTEKIYQATGISKSLFKTWDSTSTYIQEPKLTPL